MAKLVTQANKYSRLAGRPLAVAGGTYIATTALSSKVTAFQNPWIAGGIAVTTAAVVEGIFYYFGNDIQATPVNLETILNGMSTTEISQLLAKMGMDDVSAQAAANAFEAARKKKRKAA